MIGAVLLALAPAASGQGWEPPVEIDRDTVVGPTVGALDLQAKVVANASGDTVAMWAQVTSSSATLRAARRPAGEDWEPAEDVATMTFPIEDGAPTKSDSAFFLGIEDDGDGGRLGGSGASRTRTDDPFAASEVLFQLSYSPEVVLVREV